MSIKKPSDFFNKKENNGVFETPEVSPNISESYNKFVDNFEKVNDLSEKVENLSQQLSEKLDKTDLENAMLSQLMVLDENFKTIQSQVKGLNKEDLREFRSTVSNLSQVVDNLVENELPKYKNQLVKSKVFVGEQVQELQGIVEENITGIREEIDEKFDNIAEVIDNNLEYFDNQLQETSSKVKKTVDTYNKISKILENKVAKENEKFEEYSQIFESLTQSFEELSYVLKKELDVTSQLSEEKFEEYKTQFEHISTGLEKSVDNRLDSYRKELVDVKADVVINEEHLKKVENYIKENYSQIVDLREEVFSEIEKLPVGNIQENIKRLENKIDYIKETYSKIEPEVVVKEVIKEGFLNEPPSTNNSDPLTPLDKNFVTLDQLQQHYRLFINRIQQQLSTLGGGGETQLKYLDDVVGIATNASAYDGKFLKYNHTSGKFEFSDVDITNDYWVNNAQDEVYTLSRVAIGTDHIGTGSTVLLVNGDARITGILSIGQGTVTIDGNTNEIQVSNIIVRETLVNNDGVGYATETYVNNLVAISTFSGNYRDLFNSPTSLSDFSNDFGYATETYVDTAVSNLIDSAPATLDTLNELAAALADDANFAATVTNTLALKAPIDNANLTGVTTTPLLNVGVGGTIITTTGIGSVGIGSTQPTSKLTVGGDVRITGIVTATSFVKDGGTSSQFLKADGSVDSSIYLKEYTETNDLTSAVTWANVPDANITESSVTQHQAALSITESQISDLQTYLTTTGSGINLSGIVTSIVAGSGISIDQSTGRVTITNTSGGGGGGSSGVEILNNGSSVGTGITAINFNTDLTATVSGTTATVNSTAAGGGGISESLAIAYAIAL